MPIWGPNLQTRQTHSKSGVFALAASQRRARKAWVRKELPQLAENQPVYCIQEELLANLLKPPEKKSCRFPLKPTRGKKRQHIPKHMEAEHPDGALYIKVEISGPGPE